MQESGKAGGILARVSTSSEDTATTDTTPTDETPEAPTDPEVSTDPEASPAAGEAFLAGRPAPRRNSLFGAETFSVAGLFMLITTLLTTQLIGIFNQQTLTGAQGTLSASVQGELTGAGLFSALAVVFAAVSLVRAGADTRPWARHLAAATVLAGVLLALLTVLSYVLLTGA